MFLKTQNNRKYCSGEHGFAQTDCRFVSNHQFSVVLAKIQIYQHGKIQGWCLAGLSYIQTGYIR